MNRVTELCGHMWTDEAVCALPRRVHGEHLDHAYQAAVLVPLPLDYEAVWEVLRDNPNATADKVVNAAIGLESA